MRSLRIQRTMYIILLNNIERADCMLLLNNETRKIIFRFPVLWFWLRRPTIQFPGSVTWWFNYCVDVYSTSVTNHCDTIISLSQLVTPCYISYTWSPYNQLLIHWKQVQSAGIVLLLSHSQAVVLFWVIFLFDFLIITRRRQNEHFDWDSKLEKLTKKNKWVPRPVVLVRLNPTNLVTMTMTIMVQLPLGRRWTSKPRIRKCSIVVALTSFRVTLGTRHR